MVFVGAYSSKVFDFWKGVKENLQKPLFFRSFNFFGSSEALIMLSVGLPKLIRGLHLTGNTSNNVGYAVTPVTVAELPGLNTFGISMARIDFAPMGINPPHTHPRATETPTVIEGTILVGFVTSNPENRLITKVLVKGDVFVFPEGLSHFQKNLGNGYALALGALSSQNPGVITIANDVFGSNPDIAADILAKAFQTDINVVYQIQSKF
ncbi:hypothetical protein E3N88_08755 [Mikania micrantha]|uniref:Germin-like protein n=1 Tax=Mikania micrantha TaxID=192012 RepID=A0A5N6PH41_9ASTR|nr:hypothetical protein E3N88_08755 [Mikania micrantha]